MTKITYGMTKYLSWLAILARDKDLFRPHIPQIDFRMFPTGRKVMTALQKGWVDVANVIDANVAWLALEKKPKVKLLACTQINEYESVVVRRDSFITSPGDLAGKTVGYLPRTSSHIFLLRFMEYYGIDPDAVTLSEMTPEVMQRALLRGSVDAVSIWEPYVTNIRLQAAQEDIPLSHFPNEGFYKFYVLLGCTEKLYRKDKESLHALMTALQDAAGFMQSRPAEAAAVIAAHYNLPPRIFSRILPKCHPSIKPVEADFWEQVRLQAQWLAPDAAPDYDKFIDSVCVTL